MHQGLPTPRRYLAIFAVSAGSVLLMIDATVATVALPTIARDLNVDGSAAVLVATIYQLILAMTLMPLAALGDRMGHRRLYQAGLLLYIVAAVLCFFANNLSFLLIVRTVQALGAAAALSVSFGLLRSIYPPSQLGRGLGINTIACASGTALAPAVGGFILSVASWPWVFAAAAPLAIVSLILGRALPNPERASNRSTFSARCSVQRLSVW